jgi:hypothetical protein
LDSIGLKLTSYSIIMSRYSYWLELKGLLVNKPISPNCRPSIMPSILGGA